jgi:Polyketide cyclase / dehydrase and lipid transport
MAKAYYSTVFRQPAAEIWRIIRDFNNYTVWVDGAGESAIEDGKSGDTVGAVRNVLYQGRHVRQRLLAQSDVERSQTYEFCGAPTLPMSDFQATLRITPVIDGDGAFSSGGPPSIASLAGAASCPEPCAAGSRNGSNRCGQIWPNRSPNRQKTALPLRVNEERWFSGRFRQNNADIGHSVGSRGLSGCCIRGPLLA